LGHLLNIAAIQIQLFCNLFVGQIKSHEIQAEYPYFERLTVSGKYSAGQIIEAFCAILTLIALLIRLCFVVSSPDDIFGITPRALYSSPPAQFANRFLTVSIIYQVFYIYLHLLGSGFEGVQSNNLGFSRNRYGFHFYSNYDKL